MAALAEAFIAVRADTSRVKGDVSRGWASSGAEGEADRHGSRVGAAFGSSMAKAAKFAIAGIGGGLLAGAFLGKQAIDEARESEKVTRITENAIRATGGAAKVTAQQVGDLSNAISNKTGIDDEQIQASANLLLTFKNVRDEVGKGANIFDRATAAAQDMAAAGFGDADSAAKMLGKALNDPVKGLTALGRAGVTFSAQQKEQIAGFVKTGDLLSAQKIIMQEVESQVGGAAAAAADPMQKLGVVIKNAEETIGLAFLPVIEKAADWLGTHLPGAISTVGGWFSKLKGWIDVVVSAFNDPDVTSDGFTGMLERIGSTARVVFDFFKAEVLPRLRDFGGYVTGTIVPALADFGAWINKNKDFFIPFIATLGILVGVIKAVRLAVELWTVAQEILDVVLSSNPIGIVVVAIAAFVGAVVLAYNRSETFRAVVQAAWAGIKVVIGAVVDWFTGTIWPSLKKAYDDVSNVVRIAGQVIGAAWEGMRSAASAAWSWIRDNVIGPLKSGLDGVKGFIEDIGKAWDGVKGFFSKINPFGGGGGGGGAGGGKGGVRFPLPAGSYRVGVGLNGYPGHTGQDFPTPVGTPVFSAIDGFAQSLSLGNRSYGNYVRVFGNNGLEVISAHLSKALASGYVRAGQLIGFSGSTGNSTGPHLHEEFRLNGIVQDPHRYLAFANGGVIAEPVMGVGLRSGSSYTFGENGPETVTPGVGSGPIELAESSLRRLAVLIRTPSSDTALALRAGGRS